MSSKPTGLLVTLLLTSKVGKCLSSEGTPLLKYMVLTCGVLKTPFLFFAGFCVESMSSGTLTQPRSLAAPRERYARALKELIYRKGLGRNNQ